MPALAGMAISRGVLDVVHAAIAARDLAGWAEADKRFHDALLEASGNDPELVALVCGRVRERAEKLAPEVDIKVLLAGYHSEVLYFG